MYSEPGGDWNNPNVSAGNRSPAANAVTDSFSYFEDPEFVIGRVFFI
jgi:hypothetical protein